MQLTLPEPAVTGIEVHGADDMRQVNGLNIHINNHRKVEKCAVEYKVKPTIMKIVISSQKVPVSR